MSVGLQTDHSKTVEIIIPVYNVVDYIEDCVDSVLRQTYEKIHVWLIDDGSTDGCSDICDKYASIDARITVIHKINGGQASARNTALELLSKLNDDDKGAYVTFIDSDDWVEPDFIEFLVSLINSADVDAAQCGHYISFSNKRELSKSDDESIHFLDNLEAMESILRNGIWDITVWNKLFKMSVFEKLKFPEGIYYEDTAIAPYFTKQVSKAAVCMTPKYHYRQRYNSTANGVSWNNHKLDFIDVGDDVADYVLNLYPTLSMAALEKQVFVRLSTLSQMVNCGYDDISYQIDIRNFILDRGYRVLFDAKAQLRDKIGIAAVLVGLPFFKCLWKVYYTLRRRSGID